MKVKTTSEVIYTVNMVKTITKYKEQMLDKENVQRIMKALSSVSLKDKNAKKEHVKALKNDMVEKTTKIENNQCPKCGVQLVDRSGKFGKFKGCGNFPKCRFVVK